MNFDPPACSLKVSREAALVSMDVHRAKMGKNLHRPDFTTDKNSLWQHNSSARNLFHFGMACEYLLKQKAGKAMGVE